MPDDNHFQDFLSSFQSDKFRTLRPAQSEVLKEYTDQFEKQKDVAVELPTGAGKTLIALLIAEENRRCGKRVAILSANKTLAHQLRREAQELGIPIALFEGSGQLFANRDKRRYSRAQAIGVMNYWVYFNQRPSIDPAQFLIMDDAHLAENCLHSLFSVEINRFDHEDLFSTLATELERRLPEYSVLSDALQDECDVVSPPELMSFFDQVALADRITEIIDASEYLKKDRNLDFSWQRMRKYLTRSNVYFSRNIFWIRPYIYPLTINEYYSTAEKIIYMSATIGEPSDLARRLGVRNIKKIKVEPEIASVTTGRRLVLINGEKEGTVLDRIESVFKVAIKRQPKSVWLCSSRLEATELKESTERWLDDNGFGDHQVWLLTSEGDEIEEFSQASAGHLFVAGRFDGMDFSGDECRLVILTSLPRSVNIQEEFISAYLRDSQFMKSRTNQRIVQALGRCNRDDGDYATYILVDPKFDSHFGYSANQTDLTPRMIAEIDLAQDLNEQPITEVTALVDSFLNGDFVEFDEKFDDYLSDLPNISMESSALEVSEQEVLGWTAMFSNENYRVAEEQFETCWNAAKRANRLEICAYFGFLRAKAIQLQSRLSDPSLNDKAMRVLENAIQTGGTSAWFNRLRASINRVREEEMLVGVGFSDDYFAILKRNIDDLLEELGPKRLRFDKYCARIGELLKSESHNEYQEGLEKLGRVLGYDSQRPRHSGATDCRWRGVFGSGREFVTFEAKIEDHESSVISLSDVGQARNQNIRAEKEYKPNGFEVRSTIVTHLTELSRGVPDALPGLKIVNKEAIESLWKEVHGILSVYRDRWDADSVETRHRAGTLIKGSVPDTGWLIRALDTDETFIDSDRLLREWRD